MGPYVRGDVQIDLPYGRSFVKRRTGDAAVWMAGKKVLTEWTSTFARFWVEDDEAPREMTHPMLRCLLRDGNGHGGGGCVRAW